MQRPKRRKSRVSNSYLLAKLVMRVAIYCGQEVNNSKRRRENLTRHSLFLDPMAGLNGESLNINAESVMEVPLSLKSTNASDFI